MSALRVLRRKKWVAKCPPIFDQDRIMRRRLREEVLSAPPVRFSFHKWMVETKNRHPTFQRALRLARIAMGLEPTSSNMYRLHGHHAVG